MNAKAQIRSFSNALVKQVRALRRGKVRAQSGLFLVEGLHHIGSALEAGWRVDSLLYAPELLTGEYAASLLTEAQRLGITPQPVSSKVMEKLAEKDNPQGLLAVVQQRNMTFIDVGRINSAVALVSPQDPGNVGAVLRTLDAVGAEALFLLNGGVELYHPSLVRASMGTLFWKPVVRATFADFVEWIRAGGMTLIGSSAQGEKEYGDYHLTGSRWVLVMGNEQKGLSPEQIAACDACLAVPMHGRMSSLNLAVATGILLYALRK